MEVLLQLIIAFSLNLLTPFITTAFIITNLIDYRDFQEDCIVHYLRTHQASHNLNFSSFNVTKTFDYCDYEIKRFQRSFYNTIEEHLSRSHEKESQIAVQNCSINQLRAYNVSDVFLKAIAYNYYPTKFVTYNSAEESCKGIIKFNNNTITDVCGERGMAVILTAGNKSVIELQSCLNDLFRELELNKIVLNDEFDSSSPNSIHLRSFGMHAVTFIQLLARMAINLCMSIKNIDEMFNATQLKAIENLFRLSSEDFVEKFHEFTTIDLFGFTQPSKNVEQCIIDEHRWGFINRIYSSPAKNITDIDKKSLQKQNLEDFIRIILSCLKFF